MLSLSLNTVPSQELLQLFSSKFFLKNYFRMAFSFFVWVPNQFIFVKYALEKELCDLISEIKLKRWTHMNERFIKLSSMITLKPRRHIENALLYFYLHKKSTRLTCLLHFQLVWYVHPKGLHWRRYSDPDSRRSNKSKFINNCSSSPSNLKLILNELENQTIYIRASIYRK